MPIASAVGGQASGATLSDDGTTLMLKVPVTAGGTVSGCFGDIAFSEAGVYTYKIKESTNSGDANMTYSQAEYTVTVTVTKTETDNNGTKTTKLSATSSIARTAGGDADGTVSSGVANFINRYVAPKQEKKISTEDQPSGDVSGSKLTVGDYYYYTVTWNNDYINDKGKADKAYVSIEDTLPTGVAYVSAEVKVASGNTVTGKTINASAQTVSVDLGEQAANATGSLVIKVRVTADAATTFGNKATVKIGPNGSQADKKTTEVPNYLQKKDVTVTKAGSSTAETGSGNGRLVGAGDTLTYTISWANDSENENGATVVVTDSIPAGTTYVPGSAMVGTETKADADVYKDGVLTFDLGTKPKGDTGTVSFSVTVNSKENGKLGDSNGAIVNDDATVTINNTPHVTNKTENPTPFKEQTNQTVQNAAQAKVGDTLTYKLTFKNTDGANATAEVVDTLTKGLKFDTSSTVKVANGTLDGSATVKGSDSDANGTSITWKLKDLKENETVTIEFTATVTAASLAQVENSFTVNGHTSNVETTPSKRDNAKHVYNADGTQIDGATVAVGDTLTYKIDWMNPTDNDKSTVTVVDTLPAGVVPTGTTAVDLKDSVLGEPTFTYNNDGTTVKTITWSADNIAAGTKGTITFTAKVDNAHAAASGQPLELKNTATVNNYQVTATNYVNTKTVDVKNTAGNTVEDASGKLVGVGDELTYTISWKNTTESDAQISIFDKVPAGTTLTSVPSADGFDVTCYSDEAGNTKLDDTSDLSKVKSLRWVSKSGSDKAKSASGNVTFTVKVDDPGNTGLASVVNDQAKVKVGKDGPEIATETTTNPTPKKTLTTKLSGDKATVGQELTYEISFTADTTGVTAVTDTLDALEYVGGSAKLKVGEGDFGEIETSVNKAGTKLTWNVNTVTGTSYTIQLTAKPTRDAAPNAVNQASVGGHDTNKVTTPVDVDDAKHAYNASGVLVDNKLVGVGDTITYKVDWANDDTKGMVKIEDSIPTGLKVDESSISNSGTLSKDGKTITLELKDTEANARGTVSYKAVVTQDGTTAGTVNDLKNTAKITKGSGSTTTPDPSTTVEVPGKKAELGSAGSGSSAALLKVDDVIYYTVAWKNTAGEAATVTIEDSIPANTEYVTGSAKATGGNFIEPPDGQNKQGKIVWTLKGDDDKGVAKDASGTVTFAVKVLDSALGQSVNNTATVTVGDNPGCNTNTTTGFVPKKDVSVQTGGQGDTASDQNGAIVGAGDVLTYTISWKNTTGEKADVTVTDTVPANTSYVASSATTGSGVTLKTLDKDGNETSSAADARSLSWTIAGQAAGTEGSVQFKVTVDDLSGGTVEKIVNDDAKLSLKPESSPSTELTVDVNSTENPTPQKAQTSPAAGTKVKYGDSIGYTVSFTADADGNATVVDQLGAGLTYNEDAQVTVDNTASTLYTQGNGDDPSWIVPNLTKGQKVVISFTATVNGNALAKVESVALVNGHKTNVVPTDVEDEKAKHAFGATGKNIDGKLVAVGDIITYTVNWVNPNADGKGTVTVTDTLPEGLLENVSSISNDGTLAQDGKSITWTFTNQKRGKVSFTAKVAQAAENANGSTTEIKNSVAVDGATTTDSPLEVTNYVPGKDTKVVSKTDDTTHTSIDGKMVGVVDKLTYTVNWVNNYANTASGATDKGSDATAVVTDNVPDGVTLVSAPDATMYTGKLDADGAPTGEMTTDATQAKSLKWEIASEAAKNPTGSVSFNVEVDQTCVSYDAATNKAIVKATKKVDPNNPEDPASSTTKTTNEVTNPYAKKTVKSTSIDGGVSATNSKVGDTVTFKINWRANVDGNVTITDVLPDGLTFLSATEGGTASGQTVTWTLKDKKAATADAEADSGTVSVTAQVNEKALKQAINNNATIAYADKSTVTTNTQSVPQPQAGSLTVEKKVVDGDTSKSFVIAVNAKDAAGNKLSGDFSIGDNKNVTFTNGKATLSLKHDKSVTLSLPEGATYTVEETAADNTENGVNALVGYNPSYNGCSGDGCTIVANTTNTATVTNTYGATYTLEKEANTDALFTKKIDGRDWFGTDSFGFTLTPVGNAPLRNEYGENETTRTKDVTSATAKSGEAVTFGFGSLYYTFDDIKDASFVNGVRTKTFTYQVTENDTSITGMTKDSHTATLTVTLTDDGAGNLSAGAAVATATNAVFTNTYDAEVDYNKAGGIQVQKTLTGRDMTEGQFSWTVVPATSSTATADEAAKALGIDASGTTIKSVAANSGVPATMALTPQNSVKFSRANAGKTYSYTVSEVRTTGDGKAISDTAGAAGYSITKGGSGYTVDITVSYDQTTGVVSVATPSSQTARPSRRRPPAPTARRPREPSPASSRTSTTPTRAT